MLRDAGATDRQGYASFRPTRAAHADRLRPHPERYLATVAFCRPTPCGQKRSRPSSKPLIWVGAERAKLSRHAEVAKAIDYMLPRVRHCCPVTW